MKINYILIPLLLVSLLLLPSQALAVEYQINDVQIDAYLQENGNVKVYEAHTYSFEGEFNGITRTIIPKRGTQIRNLEAREEDVLLKMEQEDNLYRIYRGGDTETFTVMITYDIIKGVDVYPDVAEFYWPFFDDGNESDYENFSVTVYPPSPADEVIAFGYDEAFGTESPGSEGEVHFELGYVPSHENGDIRVAYDSKLFSTAPLSGKEPMKEQIISAKEEGIKEALQNEKVRGVLSTTSYILLPLFSFVLGLLIVLTMIKGKQTRRSAIREMGSFTGTPEQRLSMPATILFTHHQLPGQAIAAGLLDLVRLGYVKKLSNDRFLAVNRDVPLKHQKILMTWLFDKMGAHNEFSIEDLNRYMKFKVNHEEFSKYQSMWTQAIKEEVKGQGLYEKKEGFRIAVGLTSILLVPFLFLFPIYDLFPAFFITLVLFFAIILHAIVYHPKTEKGISILLEWRQLKQRFTSLSQKDWDSWTEDEKMRAFIYALGINEKSMRKKNEEFVSGFQIPISRSHPVSPAYSGMDVTTLLLIGNATSSSFHTASRNAASTMSDSGGGGGAGGGSGAGGGGGGSGGF
ncbi:putative membrane protein [Bacillus tianshenii]|uniref:Membrane protein n=1 Tax=Sutcliffiella tianshenii TaxID=1463404 RepID=A0ABS2P4D9_9BACI|nr:DUF2207 domain-containing protein [Bacillus tianshenii]MBM7621835.1 putative membrane protein [Bacillus tianshenii]